MSLEDYGKSTISVGPWGGQGGFHWNDGVWTTIRQLVIAHGSGIDSIRIEYELKGVSVWSDHHGGNGGNITDQVKLEYPDEFLTSVHGHYGSLNEWGPVFVRSLTFESNKRTYGPYGIEQGTYFSFPMTGGKIVGFHGKCGWYLDAIGVYLEPLHKPILSNPIVQSQSYTVSGVTEKFGYSMIQGSVGTNYDLIVAVKQKDDYMSYSRPYNEQKDNYTSYSRPPYDLSRQTSSSSGEYNDKKSRSKVEKMPIARIPSKNVQGVVTYGPWGGTGGSLFDDGIYDGIRQINLSRNVGIVSIKVYYEQNGQALWGSKNGGKGGFKTDKIEFDYPSEILTHITGYHGPTMIMGPNVIKSLTFHTTKTTHGPFGEEQGQQFFTKLREGMIVGFHGRKGLFLDAIGVHVVEGKVGPRTISPSNSFSQAPTISPPNSFYQREKIAPPLSFPSNSINQLGMPNDEVENPHWPISLGRRALPPEEVSQRVVKDPAPYGPGPWGGDGGRPWDDGVFSDIKQIILTKAEAICSIEIEYDRSGQSVWSVKHGGNAGLTAHRVKLEYPHEVLTCISGYYGPINKDDGAKVIKSLTFITSRGRFGPFGEELGTFFTSTRTEGKVVGFHGRSGMYLDAIGVHMQHWLGNQRAIKSSLKKFFS